MQHSSCRCIFQIKVLQFQEYELYIVGNTHVYYWSFINYLSDNIQHDYTGASNILKIQVYSITSISNKFTKKYSARSTKFV